MIIFWPTRHPEPKLFKVELYSTTTKRYTVEPRFNEPLYIEVQGITKNFHTPVKVKYMKKIDITRPRYSARFLPLGPSFYRGSTVFASVNKQFMSVRGLW